MEITILEIEPHQKIKKCGSYNRIKLSELPKKASIGLEMLCFINTVNVKFSKSLR